MVCIILQVDTLWTRFHRPYKYVQYAQYLFNTCACVCVERVFTWFMFGKRSGPKPIPYSQNYEHRSDEQIY